MISPRSILPIWFIGISESLARSSCDNPFVILILRKCFPNWDNSFLSLTLVILTKSEINNPNLNTYMCFTRLFAYISVSTWYSTTKMKNLLLILVLCVACSKVDPKPVYNPFKENGNSQPKMYLANLRSLTTLENWLSIMEKGTSL